jgi:serine/threonine protein kinase
MDVPKAEPAAGLTPERWGQIQAVFHSALDSDPAVRAAFLDQACGTDVELRAEVESLLAAERPARGFLGSVTDSIIDELGASLFPTEPREFEGNERFLLQRKLGSGGFGSVFEAYDREQSAVVALKSLHRAGPSEIYRFKREFRSLVDISHPNLVPLYELLSDGDHWFFTMEMIAGTNFLEYVRLGESGFDPVKLRDALAQLAAGVSALHESGRLHRDLKPSNVLITQEGRVAIVDFGLVADVDGSELRGPLAGTPAYMAPEQLDGGRASTATDWYSVGVMLFRALTGRLPSSTELLRVPGESRDEPLVPSLHDAVISSELDDLCQALLRRDPSQRPIGQDVLRRLGITGLAVRPSPQGTPLVGREHEISRLTEELLAVSAGGTAAVCVTGGSGMGKTALVHHFLSRVQRDHHVLTLTGRCYQQESVPYKGLDEVMDALAAHLQTLAPSELHVLIDRDTAVAARLFPVLEAFTPITSSNKIGSQELQQAAFSSLRSLLKRLSERKPLIVYIDDLQWSNADSFQLLIELIRPPSPPKMLLIVSYRSEDQETDAVNAVTGWHMAVAGLCRTTEIALRQLGVLEARKLTALLLPDVPDGAEWVASVAGGSGGNLFLLEELAQFARSRLGYQAMSSVSVEEMLQSRVSTLPLAARRLLEIVAIAGHPVESTLACKAAQHEGAQQPVLGLLQAQRLIQARPARSRQEIEPYHDRVRQTIEKDLTAEVRGQLHLRLALELETSSHASPESLAVHFHEGRDRKKAFQYSIAAAESASRALAFERAVHWYELAVAQRDAGECREVRVKLADALSSSGRGRQAAEIYTDCLEGATPIDQLELRRKAATELLVSGHTQEGLEALIAVLGEIGMSLPQTARRIVFSLLLNRAHIRISGLHWRPPGREMTAREVSHADASWSVIKGLSMVNTMRAAEFHSRNLLRTLRLGDPYHASRALSVEAGYSALSGCKAQVKTKQILDMATRLAQASGNSDALGLTRLVSGMVAFLEGKWASARESLYTAEDFLRQQCTGVAWELATARLMHCTALYFLGEIKELSKRLPVLLENAKARGDLYESTHLQIRVAHVLHLAGDAPEVADEQLRAAVVNKAERDFHLEDWWAMIAGIEIAIYRGDARAAWQLVRSMWGPLRRSLLMRVQYVRIESFVNRAFAALALASVCAGERKRLVRVALSDATKVEREQTRWATALAGLIRAGAAAQQGRTAEALRHLISAESNLRAADMQLLAAAARRRQGQLIGGDEGRGLTADADDWMKTQHIASPETMAGMLVPGVYSR